MKFLIAAPGGVIRDRHFPNFLVQRLERLGTVAWNPFERAYTPDEMAQAAQDADVIISHWGTPRVDEAILDAAPRLRLLAHGAGSVAGVASDALYARNIPVISANSLMAQFVAEGVLGYLLLALRDMIRMDSQLKSGGYWPRDVDAQGTLFGTKLGLVGLGSVGRHLLNLLAPFGCSVAIYDPYLPSDALASWPFAHQVETLQAAMCQPIVSVHAAKTPETFHMIDAAQLSHMPDGGLLINTARGAIIDEAALIDQLEQGRLHAVLDVYEREPLSLDSPLRRCANATIFPHMAGAPGHWQLTQGIIEDLERWVEGEPLQLLISHRQFQLMTQE